MIQTILAFTLAICFFALEPLFRKGKAAKSLERTSADKGSSNLIVALFWFVIILPPLLNFLQVGQSESSGVRWLGLLIMGLGLGLRFWSMQVLGEYYTRTLRVTETQAIVSQGPYRVIRHPGYLGTICVWLGFALAVGNWVATLIATILLFGVYGYRIRSEEVMLVDRFGNEYREYCKRSWRLVPFVY
jgi:protein-S-isoprenylcysteine O-methyltransferase Ste14